MSLEVKSIKCPNCGATLSIEEGRKSIFCSYCGSNLQLHNENEYTVNIHDEAEVKKTEADYLLKLEKMKIDQEDRKRRSDNRKQAFENILMIIMLILFGFFALVYSAMDF